MKIAIISDIHSNLEALQACLTKIDEEGVDTIVCLGDIIGYGPNPNECMDLVRKYCDKSIIGNHDSGVINKTDILLFNSFAKKATLWTREVLRDEHYEFLLKLPLKEHIDNYLFVHSTPLLPEDWNYILTEYGAEKQFNYFSEDICFVGHSHKPAIFKNIDGRRIINVGSIGQPRDGNNKSCFMIFDTEIDETKFVRVQYDIKTVQKKIIAAGLDSFLARRLQDGL